MSPYEAGLILAWLAIGILAFANAGLLRQINQLRAAMQSRPGSPVAVGTEVPEFERLQDAEGKPSIFVFARHSCAGCEVLAEEIASTPSLVNRLEIGFLYEGAVPAAARSFNGILTWGDMADSFEKHHIGITPFAVLVRNGMILDAKPAGSLERILQLLDSKEEMRNVRG